MLCHASIVQSVLSNHWDMFSGCDVVHNGTVLDKNLLSPPLPVLVQSKYWHKLVAELVKRWQI